MANIDLLSQKAALNMMVSKGHSVESKKDISSQAEVRIALSDTDSRNRPSTLNIYSESDIYYRWDNDTTGDNIDGNEPILPAHTHLSLTVPYALRISGGNIVFHAKQVVSASSRYLHYNIE